MGTKVNSNYEDLITYTRASKGHALRPVSYGDELVENGTFNTDVSGWTETDATTVSLSYDAERLRVLSTASYEGVYQDITTTVGRIYSFTRTVEGGTGTLRFRTYAGPASGGLVDLGGISAIDNGAGSTETFIFIATSTTTRIQMQSWNTFADFWLDNISVKEVTFDQPDGTLTLFEHPENVPRVEYDADGNRLGLLVEEARTNLVTYSEDFTTGWSRSNILPFGSGSTSNAITAPDGTTTADLIVPTTASNNSHFIRTTAQPSVGVGTVATFSVFVKAAGYTSLSLRLINTDATSIINYDLTAVTASASDGSITAVGNGWYRCTIKGASTNGTAWPWIYPNQQATFAGDGTSGIYIWGAQVEAGLFPTSYMKNEGTASGKDRSADVASIPVADFGYNTEVGSVVAEYLPIKVDSTIRSVFELAKDNNDRLYSSSSTSKHWFVKSGGTDQASLDLGSSTEDQLNKIAGAYKQNDFAASLDGGSVTTDTSGVVQTGITDLHIGGIKNATQFYLNGHIKSIKYYPRRLTNAQLQDLTS